MGLPYVSVSIVFPFAGAPTLKEELRREVSAYRAENFSANTKKTYQSHLTSYLKFCDLMDIVPVPASEETVALYAAYLARRLKPSSVTQYINIIRVLHLECGLPHPFKESWLVKTTVKGIERTKGCAPARKTPITPELLLAIKRGLNLATVKDCVFWAACLVLFFGLLRKSNLFQDDGSFDPKKQLTRDSVSADHQSLTITVSWSKTIQRHEKVLTIRLPLLPHHPLCPVKAVVDMFIALGPADPKEQAFPLKGSDFNQRLRALTAGLEGDFSSHSFRRGGATWALNCAIPESVIRMMGDWKSQVYLQYLDQLPQNVIDRYRRVFAKQLPR